VVEEGGLEKECVYQVVAWLDAGWDLDVELQLRRARWVEGEPGPPRLGKPWEPRIHQCKGLPGVCHEACWSNEDVNEQSVLVDWVGVEDVSLQVERSG